MKLRQCDVQLFSPKLLSLLLLQCFVENVILKLFLHIVKVPNKDVLIFPKVFSCAGTKWFFSLNYVPLLQCVTLHLIRLQNGFEVVSHSVTDKTLLISRPSSWYSDPYHQAGDYNYSLLQSALSGRRCEPELHCLYFLVGTALICVFPSSCWYCSVDVSASCRAVVTGDNVGNVVLLSTSGEEVCMAPCSISSTGIFMAHVVSSSTGTLQREASDLQLRRWVHSLSGWWEILHFCHPVDILHCWV